MNQNTTYQNFSDALKNCLEIFSFKSFILGKKSKFSNPSFYFKKPVKENAIKTRLSRMKEIIKIRGEINEIENINTMEKNLYFGSLKCQQN